MEMKLSEDTFNRLSLGIIEKQRCTPEEAIQKLESLKISLVCGEKIKESLPLQAALITAVNTGKRAFLGGVYIQIPANTPCLLPWPAEKNLNDILAEVGGYVTDETPIGCFSLMFGLPGDIETNSMRVICNNWQGGVLSENIELPFDESGTIPTGGIFAGGLAIGLAFLKESGITISSCDKSVGVSLWRPDLHWLDETSKGPNINLLPKKYWLLGLGHLGQAYIWNIGLLPYQLPHDITLFLQDYDRIVEANVSAGLLCEKKDAGIYKTRKCNSWLEARGFNTIITERKFDEHTRRVNDEPFVALCGFDSASSRLNLEEAGFDLIVEAALGNSLATFDNIILHTFPEASKSSKEIWGDIDETKTEINEVIHNILKEKDKEKCGIVPLSIASKAISASFVGACSGAMVIAELLKGLHGGKRFEKIIAHLREIDNIKTTNHKKDFFTIELSRNGFSIIEKIECK